MVKSAFLNVTDKVIDNLEGGYFHPDMFNDGRLKYNAAYASSGETMFGIDRKNGTSLASSPAWAQFWKIIDNAGARKKWKWNYRGGSLEPQLTQLTGEMMYPHFMRLYNKYLTTASRNAVVDDQRLGFHFSYASWNGEGWFKYFAGKINDATAKNITDTDKLTEIAISNRVNSSSALIRQSGEKIKQLSAQLDSGEKKNHYLDVFNPDSWIRLANIRF